MMPEKRWSTECPQNRPSSNRRIVKGDVPDGRSNLRSASQGRIMRRSQQVTNGNIDCMKIHRSTTTRKTAAQMWSGSSILSMYPTASRSITIPMTSYVKNTKRRQGKTRTPSGKKGSRNREKKGQERGKKGDGGKKGDATQFSVLELRLLWRSAWHR